MLLNRVMEKTTSFKCQSPNSDDRSHASYWKRDRHFTWSSEPPEGQTVCRAKAAPSYFSYLKTLSIGPAPGIGPGISRSAIQSPTALANGTAVG